MLFKIGNLIIDKVFTLTYMMYVQYFAILDL